ncbi:MAG: APC family permease [Candidatus Sumerlaeota bacterium]|nr:APC family permease [Candidatus Sumerlaeota bacterium]
MRSEPPDPSSPGASDGPRDPSANGERWGTRLRRFLIGKPRDLSDRSIFHRLSLVPFLAWVGLGADGLSSSCYGPEEAFRTLGENTYLAIALALAVVLTVSIVGAASSHIIEEFPLGGGGYNVATKLLGERTGVLSGCALLVDYVLTITVSIASAGDALFSLLPPSWHEYKLPACATIIMALTVLNMRGVKESVLALLPIFLAFLITHAVLIFGSIGRHVSDLPALGQSVAHGFHGGLHTLGLWGMLLLFLHAFSLGGGTYTGLEAVSNGLPIMREPRVATGQRTMFYMATSLSFTAGGLLLSYLLIGVHPQAGKTLNAVLVGQFVHNWPGSLFWVILTLFSEGALLIVGAQAGFIDGPRVMSNMAIDSWLPRRFASLSDRLTTQNGILLMGGASLVALLYTKGDVRFLVVMYSINVFLTFSLSMAGMLRLWLQRRAENPLWKRRVALFGVGLALCATILVITTLEKFAEGGWITLAATALVVALCFLIRSHYLSVGRHVRRFDNIMDVLPEERTGPLPPLDPSQPTAAVLVGPFGGTGVHLVMTIRRLLPDHFKSLVFLSVAVVDSGKFKGPSEIEDLKRRTRESLEKYEALAERMGIPSTSRMGVGTDVVHVAEELCGEVGKEFPQTMFFAGQVVFRNEVWYHRLLHNQTAFDLQKRLLTERKTLVIVPMEV